MPTGTPQTRDEIVALLSQCGNLSYSDFIDLLYSVVFLTDGTDPDVFISKFTGLWSSANAASGKYDIDYYSVKDSVLYQSTVNNNASTPGVSVTWKPISSVGGDAISFDPTTVAPGGTLPVRATPKFLFVGAGTFNKPEGGTIVTTENLNIVATNGTSYSLLLAIPITLTGYIPTGNIVDNLTSTDATKPLSAKQGSVLESHTTQDWIAGIYAANRYTYYAGKIWKSSAITAATDVPGVSALWVEISKQSVFVSGCGADLNALTRNGIIEVEFYNAAAGETFYHYSLGNNYTNTTHYLGLASSVNPSDLIIGIGWGTTQNIASGGVPLTGIVTYFLRRVSDSVAQTPIGKIIIDWDKVTAGQRFLETAGNLSKYKERNKKVYDTNKVSNAAFSKAPFTPDATISLQYPDIFKAIERIEIYGGNQAKRYFLKTFARNRALNGFYYFIIEEEGHSNTTGVCYFNTALVENASGVNVINLVATTGTGITGKVWINFNKIVSTSFASLLSLTITQTELSSVVHAVAPNSSPFSEANDRLVVGDKLFLVDDDNLQLFKGSMIASAGYTDKLGIITSPAEIKPNIQKDSYVIDLIASRYSNGNSVRIFNKIYGNPTMYYKDVSVVKVTRASLVGKTGQIGTIGDSIIDGTATGLEVTPYIGAMFSSWGAALTFIGLKSDGGYANEGRSSWEFANLIGLNTLNFHQVPTDLATSDNNAQPFIKVATAPQLAAHPEWCFENTPSTNSGTAGVAREKNYTESQAAGGYTGSYYTFDYARYVSLNLAAAGITIDPAKKLIMTCCLGFNDLNHNNETEQSKADVILGMTIFYNRLKQYRADAIIGFAPVLCVNEDNNWPAYANMIELATNTANTLGADIIPVWQNVDMQATYKYDTATALNATNNSKKGTSSDTVHPYIIGSRQIAMSITNWAATKL